MAIRVLRVVERLNGEGISNGLLEYLRQSDRTRVVTDVLCVGRDTGDDALTAVALGATVMHVPKHWHVGTAARRMQRTIATGRYDVVFANLSYMGAAPLLSAAAAGVQTRVAGFHSSRPNTLRRFAEVPLLSTARSAYLSHLRRAIERAATAFYAVGEVVGASVRNAFALEKRSLLVAHRGFDTDHYRPPTDDERRVAREMLGVAPSEVVVAHVGSFRPEKNHTVLLRTIAELGRDRMIRLVLLGDGAFRDPILSEAAALGLRVHAPGMVHDVRSSLWAADLMVFPSWQEGLPGAVVEAQAAGIPVVASDISENMEALAPALREFARPLSDGPVALAAAARKLLALNPEKQRALAADCREWVIRKFSAREATLRVDNWLLEEVARNVGMRRASGVASEA